MSDNFCARKDKKLMQYRYEQVAEILAAKIRNGEWQIGQKLPGEIELAREYGVGRSTVRGLMSQKIKRSWKIRCFCALRSER